MISKIVIWLVIAIVVVSGGWYMYSFIIVVPIDSNPVVAQNPSPIQTKDKAKLVDYVLKYSENSPLVAGGLFGNDLIVKYKKCNPNIVSDVTQSAIYPAIEQGFLSSSNITKKISVENNILYLVDTTGNKSVGTLCPVSSSRIINDIIFGFIETNCRLVTAGNTCTADFPDRNTAWKWFNRKESELAGNLKEIFRLGEYVDNGEKFLRIEGRIKWTSGDLQIFVTDINEKSNVTRYNLGFTIKNIGETYEDMSVTDLFNKYKTELYKNKPRISGVSETLYTYK